MDEPIQERKDSVVGNTETDMAKFAKPPPYPSTTFKVPDTRFDNEVSVLEGKNSVLK